MAAAWTVMRLTFREAVRRRIALAALVLGLAFLALYNTGLYFIQREMTANSPGPALGVNAAYNFFLMAGLYAANFLGVAMAALLTADTLAGEISTGTVQTLATKSVRRGSLVLGKWLGLAGLLILYGLLMVGGVILSIWGQTGYHAPNVAPGGALIVLNSLLIMSTTLACSSVLSTLATGGVIFGLFGLAFVGGWVERVGSLIHNATAVNVGIASSLLLPSEALWGRAAFDMTSPLIRALGTSPFSSGSVPSPLMVVYAVGYLAAALGLAVRWFGRRDL